MASTTIGVLTLLAMLTLMLARVPVAIAMSLPAVVAMIYLGGFELVAGVAYSTTWNHLLSYTLVTVPMFVLMGELLHASGVTSDVYAAMRSWLWRIRGGLALTTIGASAMFAAASGSSVATVGTLGSVATKEMSEAGYDHRLSTGTVVAGGGLGILIPPSTLLIIYGTLTDLSIGQLLIAGIVPGLVLTVLLAATVLLVVRVDPSMAPPVERVRTADRDRLVVGVGLVVLVFVAVVGGLYLGVVSATEASALGAGLALVVGLAARRLDRESLVRVVARTVRTTGFVFAIVLGSFLLNYVLAVTRLAALLTEAVAGLDLPVAAIFAVLVIAYILLGAVMDAYAMIVVTVPIVVPVIVALGLDPIWMGIVLVVLVEIALITPPVGMNVFVLKGVAPQVPIGAMFRGAAIFILPMLVLIALLYAFPDIALFLPGRM